MASIFDGYERPNEVDAEVVGRSANLIVILREDQWSKILSEFDELRTKVDHLRKILEELRTQGNG